MAQAPYPTHVELSGDNIVSTARSTEEVLTKAPSLTASILSRDQGTLGALLEAVRQPASTLLQDYLDKDIAVHTGPAWTQWALKRSIAKGPYMSACTTEM